MAEVRSLADPKLHIGNVLLAGAGVVLIMLTRRFGWPLAIVLPITAAAFAGIGYFVLRLSLVRTAVMSALVTVIVGMALTMLPWADRSILAPGP